MQKVRHFPLTAFFILFQDLFTPFSYGSFHLSLTVLLHYQSLIYIFSSMVVHRFSIFSLLFWIFHFFFRNCFFIYGIFTLFFSIFSFPVFFSFLLISFATTFNISVDFFSSYYLRSFSL